VVVKELPYGMQTDRNILREAESWCIEQWGPRWQVSGNPKGTWTVFWGGNHVENYPSTYQWWFETEQQQLMFTLRWG